MNESMYLLSKNGGCSIVILVFVGVFSKKHAKLQRGGINCSAFLANVKSCVSIKIWENETSNISSSFSYTCFLFYSIFGIIIQESNLLFWAGNIHVLFKKKNAKSSYCGAGNIQIYSFLTKRTPHQWPKMPLFYWGFTIFQSSEVGKALDGNQHRSGPKVSSLQMITSGTGNSWVLVSGSKWLLLFFIPPGKM